MRDFRGIVSVDPSEYKRAMRQLATGVAVVTSRNGKTMNGMTATAFCSVSADPPMMLVVVNRSSNSHQIIDASRSFAVNILRADQQHIAEYFAGRADKSFADVGYREGVTGCPLLAGSIATLECLTAKAVGAGSHTIFVGRVVSANTNEESPLLYRNGAFATMVEHA
ncbi:flavin reductase [Bradyrhizobium lablabi]|uniref:flavin reductase family protein n=1 Tax=Bradyrhizobium lablabi TaxID=722472 RepID=UPI001BA821B8|nr:flavin reductase family protein [Bradyrhizobium lablabi]MBR1121015.1 flavin reductase [Bradyrhizobium lablabi]